jgi:ribosomal protein S18 acetylase RimI-like enzyme
MSPPGATRANWSPERGIEIIEGQTETSGVYFRRSHCALLAPCRSGNSPIAAPFLPLSVGDVVMNGAVTILSLDSPAFPLGLKQAATELASDARGTLGHEIRGEARRRALFGPSVRPGQVIVALLDGRIAGMASFKFRGSDPVAPRLTDFVRTLGAAGVRYWIWFNYIQMRIGRDSFYIVGLDVFEGFRRRGIGSALLDELCRIAGACGVDVIEADVHAGNKNLRIAGRSSSGLLRSATTGHRRVGFQPAQYPLFSFGWLIMATNGPYTRVRLSIAPELTQTTT